MDVLLKNAKALVAIVAGGLGEWITSTLELPPDASFETVTAKVLEVAVLAFLVWLVPNRS